MFVHVHHIAKILTAIKFQLQQRMTKYQSTT